jgi:hypothetical protein
MAQGLLTDWTKPKPEREPSSKVPLFHGCYKVRLYKSIKAVPGALLASVGRVAGLIGIMRQRLKLCADETVGGGKAWPLD